MTVDKRYESIPLSRKICEVCQQEIQRNSLFINGKWYHYGCYKKTYEDAPFYKCVECGSYLTKGNISVMHMGGQNINCCGECGSPNIKQLRRRRSNISNM